MTAKGTIKGGRGGPQRATARGFNPPEGYERGEGFQKARISLQEALAEVARMERYLARQRQEEAGIKEPFKGCFRRWHEDPELEAALDRIWQAGNQSRVLYVKLGKGLACLDRADVVALGSLSATEIEALAGELAAGLTIKQAVQKSEI